MGSNQLFHLSNLKLNLILSSIDALSEEYYFVNDIYKKYTLTYEQFKMKSDYLLELLDTKRFLINEAQKIIDRQRNFILESR
jgi:hypothetical protein